MEFRFFQWLVPLLSLFYIIRTVRQYAQGKYSPRNTVIWIIFWVSIAMLAIMPDEIPNRIAKALGFKDHINAVIFVALGLLFLMVFYLSAAMNRIENQLTDLVRQLALEEALKNNHVFPNEQNLLSNNPEKKEINEKEAIISDEKNRDHSDSNSLEKATSTGKTPKVS